MLLSAHLFFFFTCEIARSVRIRMPVKNTFIYYIIHIIIQHTHMPWAAYRNHVPYILYTPWYRPHFFAYSSHSVNIQSPSSVLSFVPGAGDTNPGASRTCCGAPALSKVHPGDTFCHQTDEKALPLEESCWHLLFKKKKKKLLYN